MALKEVFIEPQYIFQEEPARVRFTTVLDDPSDLDELKRFNPEYIMVALFSTPENVEEVAFSAAKRHDELHDCLIKTYGGDLPKFNDGQLWFGRGLLSFTDPLGQSQDEEMKRIAFFFERIHPDFVYNSGVDVYVLNGPTNYFYSPQINSVEPRAKPKSRS